MNYRKQNYYSQKQIPIGILQLGGDSPSSFSHPTFPVPSASSRDFSCCVSGVGDRLQAKFNWGEHTLITLQLCDSSSHLLILFPSALEEEWGIIYLWQHTIRNNPLVAFFSHYSANYRIPGWIPGSITPDRTSSRDSIDCCKSKSTKVLF